jgi:cardiolipin synthase
MTGQIIFLPHEVIRIALEIIYFLTVLTIILKIVLQNRNPLKTTSWILVLSLLPLLGIIIYYIFGQDARQIRIISNKKYRMLKKRSSRQPAVIPSDSIRYPEYSSLIYLLNHRNEAPLLQGSRINVFTDGKSKFEALIRDLKEARHHIHLQYYIFLDDGIGKTIQALLIEKARQGVKVRVLYDDVANWQVKKNFYRKMEAAGIELTAFLQVRFPLLTSKVNYRNHRKVVVIDGKTGYIGGMNIADRYLRDNWRDTHLRVEGRGVLGMQSAFLIDWYSSGKELIKDRDYFPELPVETENLMQIVTGSPVSLQRTLLHATIRIIIRANKYVYIQTPYFLPEDSLVQSLQLAALSGIDVRLMVPAKTDALLVGAAAESYYEEMMHSGVKIYALTNAFLHAKMIVCDDFLTVAGSANMDFRSFEHNFEINTYIYDSVFAGQMKNIFLQDQEKCRQILLKDWKKRSCLKKLWASVLRLFSPLF